MKDPALVEAIRQIALLNAEIATLRAEIEAEHNALGRLGIATLEIATLRAALHRIWRADRLVHSAYDGECEHGFGPPATLCTNDGCPDKELAEAWRAALATTKEAAG
jgi:hypothetical protein